MQGKSLDNIWSGKEATIAVIGLGYVGLPLILGFHDRGFRVLGVDVDEPR